MTRLYLLGALAAAGVMAVGLIVIDARREGRKAERLATEKVNRNARDKADDADSELMRCVAAGGVYDFRAGKCGRARPDHGG